MLKKSIPATGEEIPAIGLGTWQTFDEPLGGPKQAQLEQVLSAFVAMGGRLVDTSPMYGRAEQLLGVLQEKLQLQQSLFMATKVWTSGRDQGIVQMKRSMSLLKAASIDLMQVHNLLDYQQHWPTLLQWKAEGKFRYLGITHYTNASYPALMQAMEVCKPDFVQFNYAMGNRAAEELILPFALENGIAVLVNRPFEEGSIFSRIRGLGLPAWAMEQGCNSWSQFMLKYLITHPAVSCVIPATANLQHLKDNMQAGSGWLPDEKERTAMARYFDSCSR